MYDLLKAYEQKGFPTFEKGRFIDLYTSFPCFYFSKETISIQNLKLEDLYGDNWAFESESERGNYPRIHKLESLIKGFENKSNIPPIDVYEIMGKYILREGNHRYYASRMLKRSMINARVQHYDYERWIEQVQIRSDALGLLLSDNSMNEEYIDEEMFQSLLKLNPNLKIIL